MRAGHATWARVLPVIDTIAAAQQEELEKEISGLEVEALETAQEIEELVGISPF